MDLSLPTVGPRPFDAVQRAFAEEVGEVGPVTVVGGRNRWEVGGSLRPPVREVRAPVGIVSFEPEEMTVRVRAGTPVADLHTALAAHGQRTVLPDPGPGATVGGVLAVGEDAPTRLGDGALRDAVLEITYVSAEGRLVRAGGPTVKNVSGFDLCRLLVGSLGTLGLFGEVVLRTAPRPATRRWLVGPADPFALRAALHRPAAVLWDGRTTWVLLQGHPGDVEAEAAVAAAHGLVPAADGPVLPPHRTSVDPATLRALTGRFVAEVGVGAVHRDDRGEAPPVPEGVVLLNRSVKRRFDPTERLNPGREVLER